MNRDAIPELDSETGKDIAEIIDLGRQFVEIIMESEYELLIIYKALIVAFNHTVIETGSPKDMDADVVKFVAKLVETGLKAMREEDAHSMQ